MNTCVVLLVLLSVVEGLNFGTNKRNLYDFVSVALNGAVSIITPSSTIHLPLNFTDVKHICSTGWAFAFLKTDNSVLVYGHATYGGSLQASLSNIRDIKSTKFAFAAITYDGTIHAWGHPDHGGSMHDLPNHGYSNIYSTDYIFLASTATSIVHWGDDENYLGITSITPITSPISAVYSGEKSAIVVLVNRQQLTIGNSLPGPPPPTSLPIMSITATSTSYAALSERSSISAWGQAACGGDVSTAPATIFAATAVVSNTKAFAAIAGDEVITWGDAKCGGNRVLQIPNTVALFNSECAFAALTRSGRVIIWGYLFNQPIYHETTDIHWIYATKHAFLLLSTLNTASMIGEMDHKITVNSASMIAVTDHRIAVLTSGKLSIYTRFNVTPHDTDLLTVFGHEGYLPHHPNIVTQQPRSYYVTSNHEFSFNWVSMS